MIIMQTHKKGKQKVENPKNNNEKAVAVTLLSAGVFELMQCCKQAFSQKRKRRLPDDQE